MMAYVSHSKERDLIVYHVVGASSNLTVYDEEEDNLRSSLNGKK